MKRYIIILIALFSLQCGSLPVKRSDQAVKKKQSSDSMGDELFADIPEGEAEGIKPKKKGPAYVGITRGYSAWYGKELHGKPTASGEIFNMNDYTAAHRTYPMGSKVLIRNLENGKKKLVRINDRGPYVEGRILDVSYATAKDLDFLEKGVAHVEIELIEEGSDNFLSKVGDMDALNNDLDEDLLDSVEEDFDSIMEVSASDYVFSDGRTPKGYTVRAGAFKVRVNADNYKENLEDKYNSRVFVGTKGKWHYVWIGDFKAQRDAKKLFNKLKTDGLDVMSPGKVL